MSSNPGQPTRNPGRGRGQGQGRGSHGGRGRGNAIHNPYLTPRPVTALRDNTLNRPTYLTPDLNRIQQGAQALLPEPSTAPPDDNEDLDPAALFDYDDSNPSSNAVDDTTPPETVTATPTDNNTADTTTATDTATVTANNNPPTNAGAHTIPVGYDFQASTNTEAKDSDRLILDATTDLDKAVETLVPQEEFKNMVFSLRNTMNGATLQYCRATATYKTFDGNPNLIRQSVRITPTVIKPYGLEEYSATLQPIFADLATTFDATVAQFRKEANAILHKVHQFTCFKYRLDRVRCLASQLVHNLGLAHVQYYMLSNAVQSTPAADNQSATPLALAKLAVLQVFQRIDLQMLEYLDINRVALCDFFKTNHKPDPNYLTNETNRQAVEYATTTMMSYLKPATCLYSKNKDNASHDNNIKAQMAALIKANLTTQATTAVNEAIEAANLPKDDKTLRDAITSVVTDLTTKKKQQTRNKPNKSKPAAPTPAKAAKGRNTKSKHSPPQPHPKAKGTRKPKPAGKPKQGTQNNKATPRKDQPNKTNTVKFKGILKNKGKPNGGANKETNKKPKTKHGKTKPPRQKRDK